MRGHPPGRRKNCRHCDMVDSYRSKRAADLDWINNRGGWRDERNRAIMFKEWLKTYRYEREEAA